LKKAIKQSTMVIILNVLSVAFIIVTIISLLNLKTLGKMGAQANLDRFDLTFNANRFMDGSAYLTTEVRAFAATGDIIHYNNYWNEINVLKNRNIGVARLKEIGITEDEQAKIDAMAALSNNLVPLESDAMDLRMEDKTDEAVDAVFGEAYADTIRMIRSIKEDFLTMLGARAESRVEEITTQYNNTESRVFIYVIAVAALQLVNIVLVMYRMILPIKKLEIEMTEISRGNLSSTFSLVPDTSEIGRLTSAIIKTKSEMKTYIDDIAEKLHRIADGDLDMDVKINYLGDFAPIKDSISNIITSLNNTMAQVITSSKLVSNSSRQIAGGAQSLAQGATEQAASVEQLSSSIAEIAGRTALNTETAEKTLKLSGSIKDYAEKGSSQMDDMIVAVRQINDASQSISKIIKVIDDIAFQTNILALNAAVEAARAGQHGKGFAVVAEEVRNLASKSAEAARDTGNMIQNSMEKAEMGSRIAQETALSFKEIVSGINESNHLIAEIAEASEYQSSGISQINTGISQVAQVIQQNSATAEQGAAASHEMSNQSEVLEELISRFNVNQTHLLKNVR
jgi:methyl-accepting chemotaxis protein